MPRFLQVLRAYEDRSVRKTGHPVIADALEVIAVTAARDNEVLEMQWKEINGNTWNVPPEHRKFGRRKGTILERPITKSVQAAFDRRRARRSDQSDDALVFPSDKNGGKITLQSLSRFIRENLEWPNIQPHGFRSTLRDWMRAETNFDDILWKRQVDHKSGFAPGAGIHLLDKHLLEKRSDQTDQAYGHDPVLNRRRVVMEQYDDFHTPPPAKSVAAKPVDDKVVVPLKKRRPA